MDCFAGSDTRPVLRMIHSAKVASRTHIHPIFRNINLVWLSLDRLFRSLETNVPYVEGSYRVDSKLLVLPWSAPYATFVLERPKVNKRLYVHTKTVLIENKTRWARHINGQTCRLPTVLANISRLLPC